MTREIGLVIIDDHPLFREGLKSIIKSDSRFKVIGEAGNGHDALPMISELKPDIALIDLSLPDQSGIQLTREIKSLLPDVRVMIVSMHSKIEYIAEAFQAGATGYVVKESAAERLIHGLEYLLNDNYFLDSSVSQQVVKKLINSPVKNEKIRDNAYSTLTSREQEVMRLLAEGFSTKDTAEKLFISPKTVDNHRSKIMTKLSLHSHHELIRYAARLGLIDVDLWKE